MTPRSRREFLSVVGCGMLVAGVGSSVAFDLGLANAFADDVPRLTFDKLEPLVSLMQDTPIEKLLPALVARLNEGVELRTLVAAGALANARTFGGQDYTGYHAFMALPPALEMAKELPEAERALPVLKVLYRNSHRMQVQGGSKNEVLHPMPRTTVEFSGEALQDATRTSDVSKAEITFAAMKPDDAKEAFDALQYAIQDEIDVHRVVLSWRAWTMLDIAGKEHAHTLLRQSVRYCVASEKERLDRKRPESGIRKLLPKLFDEHKLAGRVAGTKQPDAAWVEKLAEVIYGNNRDNAAEAVAMALAEGFTPEAIGEAMSLAACQLVLRDPGRTRDEEGKPKGSVHGASVGVHASDSANAWRNIARVSNARNTFASLIVGAYHTAGQSNGQTKQPLTETSRKSVSTSPDLLKTIERAILSKDQLGASVATQLYCDANANENDLFAVLLKFAVSEDGALHAEKYYRTVREEFVTTRKAFRTSHLVALARVTASEYGFPAPGYAEAKRLMNV